MGIKFKGLKQLSKELNRKSDISEVRNVVAMNGASLQEGAMRNAVFVKGYQTGNLRRSISLNLEDGGMSAVVAPTAHYSLYVEKGTRFMGAQPYLEPAFEAQAPQFLNDLKRVMR